jgi:hypothetical protein
MERGGIDLAFDGPLGLQSGVTAAALHSQAPDRAQSFGPIPCAKVVPIPQQYRRDGSNGYGGLVRTAGPFGA